jgi:type II secretory pathway pseudopilin PulG
MENMKKLQNGFSAVEALLIVIIVGMLGGVGWYVWNANNQANKNLDSASNVSSNTPVVKNKKQTPSTGNSSTAQKEYMTIKEWSVKIPVTDPDDKYSYEFDKNDPTSISVFSQKADGIVGPKGVSCKGEYIAFVLRLEASSADWNDPDKASPLFGHKTTIGKYAYAVATKKQYGPECFDSGPSNNYVADQQAAAKFDTIANQFVKDFQDIKAE